MAVNPEQVDCSIDFTREFSLPFGVPPQHDLPYLKLWLESSSALAEFCFPQGAEHNPAPDWPRRGDATGIPILSESAAAHTLVPRGVKLPASIGPKLFDKLKSIGREHPAMPREVPGKSLAEVAASQFRWSTRRNSGLSTLPMPVLPEECLAVIWPLNPPKQPPATAVIPGILADDSSKYLLPAPASGTAGEADRLLLRAHTSGLVRFERYRHVRRDSSGALGVTHVSRAGAVYLHVLPPATTPQERKTERIYQTAVHVFDNVDIEAAIECFAALTIAQLVCLDDIADLKRFRGNLKAQVNSVLRSWVAYLGLIAPAAEQAAVTLSAEQRDLLTSSRDKALEDLTIPIAQIWSAAEAKRSFYRFVQTCYAPVICGKSWYELNVDIPRKPDAIPAGLGRHHQVLAQLPESPDTWLIAYAGCPLGRPAVFYLPNVVMRPGAAHAAMNGLDTFTVEALAIAGRIPDVFPGATAPAVPQHVAPIDLSGINASRSGFLTVLRRTDHRADSQEYTTYDYLHELVKGTQRVAPEPARLDFDVWAQAGHPLASAVKWELFQRARSGVAALASLDAARIASVPLAKRVVDWWIENTGLANPQRQWPFLKPGAGLVWTAASPSDPFRDGATRHSPNSQTLYDSGFDTYDIESMLLAQQFLQDGRDPGTPVNPALIVTLALIEGYRSYAWFDRTAAWIQRGNIEQSSAPPALVGLIRVLSAVFWLDFPYGLDDYHKGLHDDASNLQDAPKFFTNLLTKVQNAVGAGSPLTAEYLWDFLLDRIHSAWRGPNKVHMYQRRSRRLQWLGMICQHGYFQYKHWLLVSGNADLRGVTFNSIPEFDRNRPAPQPGNDANSQQRRDYIAYYALVYLAFNVYGKTWNEWVDSGNAARAAQSVSNYLLYAPNAHAGAASVGPTGDPVVGAGVRNIAHRGSMLRFAVALDAYLRMNIGGAIDASDPAGRQGRW